MCAETGGQGRRINPGKLGRLRHLRTDPTEQQRGQSASDLSRAAPDKSHITQILQHLALWCSENGRPFVAAKDARLVRLLHPDVLKANHSRQRISKACHELYVLQGNVLAE